MDVTVREVTGKYSCFSPKSLKVVITDISHLPIAQGSESGTGLDTAPALGVLKTAL
jgi:hypothetical protein